MDFLWKDISQFAVLPILLSKIKITTHYEISYFSFNIHRKFTYMYFLILCFYHKLLFLLPLTYFGQRCFSNFIKKIEQTNISFPFLKEIFAHISHILTHLSIFSKRPQA